MYIHTHIKNDILSLKIPYMNWISRFIYKIKFFLTKNKRKNYKIPVGYTIKSGSLKIDASLPDTVVILRSREDLERELGKSSPFADYMQLKK